MLAIGLDVGTTSVCGIAHDIKTGEIVKSITKANSGFIKTKNSWEKIQDPKSLIALLKDIYAELKQEGEIASIGITGQMHGIVYLNDKGEPLSELKIWQDGRGNLEYKDGLTYAEYMTKITGYPLATGYGAVTYFYDKINGLVPKDAVTFCTIHDLASMTLSNEIKPLLHPSDAASLGLFDLKNNCYDKIAIEKLGLNYNMFPAVCDGFTLIGKTDDGIPVGVAIGDNQASFLGSVSNMEESLLVNVGTGSQISCLVDKIPENSELDCRPLLDNSFILAGSSLCGGRSYAILESFLREVASIVSGSEIKSAYPAMDKLMENYESVEKPLMVKTLFSGTRKNPEKRGEILHIGIDNFNMASLCDGFMCGMVNELCDMFNEMKPLLTKNRVSMVGSGNGVRNNKPLKKRFEEIFGFKMLVPKHKEEAAFGGSLYALTAAGVFSNIAEAQKLIKYI